MLKESDDVDVLGVGNFVWSNMKVWAEGNIYQYRNQSLLQFDPPWLESNKLSYFG